MPKMIWIFLLGTVLSTLAWAGSNDANLLEQRVRAQTMIELENYLMTHRPPAPACSNVNTDQLVRQLDTLDAVMGKRKENNQAKISSRLTSFKEELIAACCQKLSSDSAVPGQHQHRGLGLHGGGGNGQRQNSSGATPPPN
jgi:hypothetical protein